MGSPSRIERAKATAATIRDALPTVPPVPLLRAPLVALSGTAAAVLAVTWLATLVAQRSADRTNLAEVLRVAE